jgi:hypothetical protein
MTAKWRDQCEKLIIRNDALPTLSLEWFETWAQKLVHMKLKKTHDLPEDFALAVSKAFTRDKSNQAKAKGGQIGGGVVDLTQVTDCLQFVKLFF